MARWETIGPVQGNRSDRSYTGWFRRHTNIHMTTREPASKVSLVQVTRDGNKYTVLAQTIAHGVFTQPRGTKGKTLFKEVIVKHTKPAAMTEVRRLKKLLASRYDRVTRDYAKD